MVKLELTFTIPNATTISLPDKNKLKTQTGCCEALLFKKKRLMALSVPYQTYKTEGDSAWPAGLRTSPLCAPKTCDAARAVTHGVGRGAVWGDNMDRPPRDMEPATRSEIAGSTGVIYSSDRESAAPPAARY